MYREVEGDLILLTKEGKFDVIAHGCNCFCTMGAGIAPKMAEAFGCDRFEKEGDIYKGDINKLGTIDYQTVMLSKPYCGEEATHSAVVINAYTQFGPGFNHYYDKLGVPFNYRAFILCLEKIRFLFSKKCIGLPQIGCGLGGGDWDTVKKLIQKYLYDCDVTVVIFKPKEDVLAYNTTNG